MGVCTEQAGTGPTLDALHEARYPVFVRVPLHGNLAYSSGSDWERRIK